MRREIPLLITAVVGLFMILSFFIPHPLISDTAGTIKEWFLIIAAFAVVLGVGNLLRVNLHRIRRRGEDWGFKVVTLVALAAYLALGLLLDVGLDVRPSWLTRGLGLIGPDQKEILEGRRRLLDRRAEVAGILREAASPEEGADRLVKELSFDAEVEAPDLAGLGPAGIQRLDAATVLAEIQAERKKAAVPRRRLLQLEGRVKVTGLATVVRDLLQQGEPARTLMTRFSFSRDQAHDLVRLGPAGVLAVTREGIEAELAALATRKEPGDDVRNAADWVFKYVYTPLQATMFSLLAFFIASAAFRAFRMRTLEASLLLGAGLLVILGRVPLGEFNWGISSEEFGFHTIRQWIMNVPNTAAMRGIKMGAAMGVIVMGLKVILGIERSYLGGD